MYLAVNTAFINDLDCFPNLTESLEFPIIMNKTTFEEVLPISLNITKFDTTLLTASSDLKEFIHKYANNKEIFDLQERHGSMELNTNRNFFSENYIIDIFLFITAIISLLTYIHVHLLYTALLLDISNKSYIKSIGNVIAI